MKRIWVVVLLVVLTCGGSLWAQALSPTASVETLTFSASRFLTSFNQAVDHPRLVLVFSPT